MESKSDFDMWCRNFKGMIDPHDQQKFYLFSRYGWFGRSLEIDQLQLKVDIKHQQLMLFQKKTDDLREIIANLKLENDFLRSSLKHKD